MLASTLALALALALHQPLTILISQPRDSILTSICEIIVIVVMLMYVPDFELLREILQEME